ncbi:hypothetical protein PRZ48_003017 [Zasmidium cellare]|uniref:Uncharacterized protein n=1 Tax=Zasmidium cellare TaxID=395010 RepID=A0ABR0ETV7_ZASCE|nr:hypothetical protein PRZ48_003017 [Zasmidium cellare]
MQELTNFDDSRRTEMATQPTPDLTGLGEEITDIVKQYLARVEKQKATEAEAKEAEEPDDVAGMRTQIIANAEILFPISKISEDFGQGCPITELFVVVVRENKQYRALALTQRPARGYMPVEKTLFLRGEPANSMAGAFKKLLVHTCDLLAISTHVFLKE